MAEDSPYQARLLDPTRHEVWNVAPHDEGKDPAQLLRSVADLIDTLNSGTDCVILTALSVENAVTDEGWSANLTVYRYPHREPSA